MVMENDTGMGEGLGKLSLEEVLELAGKVKMWKFEWRKFKDRTDGRLSNEGKVSTYWESTHLEEQYAGGAPGFGIKVKKTNCESQSFYDSHWGNPPRKTWTHSETHYAFLIAIEIKMFKGNSDSEVGGKIRELFYFIKSNPKGFNYEK